MSIIQTFPFTDSINYSLTNTEINSGQAKLKLVDNTGQSFSQAFASDSGFTYDNTKAEFVGGVVRQKDQEKIPSYTANVGVTVVSDTLEKVSGVNNWDAGLISIEQLAGDGYVKFKTSFTNRAVMMGLSADNPDATYSGIDFSIVCNLDGNYYVFENGTSVANLGPFSTSDVFQVESNSGQIIYKKNGSIVYTSLNTPSFPLFLDCSLYTVGAKMTDIRILNSAQYVESKVDLPSFSYTEAGEIQALESISITNIGSPKYIVDNQYWNGSAWVSSNGTYSQANTSATLISNIGSLILADPVSIPISIVFTDSATQSSVDLLSLLVTGQKYPASGYLEPIQAIESESLESYSQTTTVDADTSVKVIMKIDGVLKYFNGSAWVTSNGSSAQSNTASEVNSNLSTLIDENTEVFIRWLLETTDQTKTPLLDEATISYDFGAVEVNPTKCIVYGYFKDISGAAISNATVKFELKGAANSFHEAGNNIINGSVSTKTNSRGYFEKELIRSSEYETSGVYRASLTKASSSIETSTVGGRFLEFEVPDAETKDLSDLIMAV